VLDLDRLTPILSRKQIVSIAGSQQASITVWDGAVRSGKTVASLIAFLVGIAGASKHGLIVCCGKTLQTIERNVLDPLQDPTLFGPLAAQTRHTAGSNTATILGRTVHLIGAHDSKSEGRLRGLTACLAYVDEATLVPEGFWMQLRARLSVPGARLLATTNPDGPAHWLHRDWLLRAGELGIARFRFTFDDNPSLSREYIEERKREFVGLWYRRMIKGEWCLAEGAVYDMWDPDRHVVDILPPIRRWISLGIDYGTASTFAALMLGLGVDGRLYFTHEWGWNAKLQHKQLTDPEYSQRLRDWMAALPHPGTPELVGIRPQFVVVDPSAASMVTQLWRDGLSPVQGNNSVCDGIRTMAGLLARDQLKVHRRCTGLINEFPGYSWDPDKALKGEDAPIKDADHYLDGGRYGTHTTESVWRSQLLQEAA
jgi:PBSX family phage terminase large subunit